MKTLTTRSKQIDHIFADYGNRNGKADFISQHFKNCLSEAQSILDVGCDNNRFKSILGSKVTGIDANGSPDYIVDLEKEKLSRFQNESFDLLICTDVLEHINNFHAVLDDMVRVSKKRLIISLPNCGSLTRILPVVFGRASGKYYGLPTDPPTDRHKWFFTWHEIQEFFQSYVNRNSLSIESDFLTYSYHSPLRRNFLHIASPIIPVTTFAQSYWVSLKK